MIKNAAFAGMAASDTIEDSELRAAPRMALVLRLAKLSSAQGEFVCVVRDVSATGISVKTFHRLPECESFQLELQGGSVYDVRKVWTKEREAGFQFTKRVDLALVVQESSRFPKRAMRLAICLPITFTTRLNRSTGTVLNLSQQGARIESDALLAIDQAIQLEGGFLGDIRAKVRWRKAREYGLVFDNTFSLEQFALLAVRLQCPGLLSESGG